MKAAVARKPVIRIAVVESDPLRFVGFRALFDSEPEFELISAALPEGMEFVSAGEAGNGLREKSFGVRSTPKTVPLAWRAYRPELTVTMDADVALLNIEQRRIDLAGDLEQLAADQGPASEQRFARFKMCGGADNLPVGNDEQEGDFGDARPGTKDFPIGPGLLQAFT